MEANANATKPAETKPMTLQDLGLEDESTPAEKAEASFIDDSKSGAKIEQKSFINAEDAVEKPKMKIPRPETIKKTSVEMQTQHMPGDNHPTAFVNGHQPAKSQYQESQSARPVDPSVYELTEEEKRQAEVKMAGLTKGDDLDQSNLTVISNLDEIAPKKKQVNPIQQTMNHLHGMVDKGIHRTEAEMTAVDGRITEAKEKYVEHRYATLMERAKQSPNLKKKIDYYQSIIDTDPTFDTATDYMKKGYILFKVAKDDSIGITDKSFGLAQESIKGYRGTSKENEKTVASTVNAAQESLEDPESGNHVILGDGNSDNAGIFSSDLPVRKADDPKAESDTTGVDIKPEDSIFTESVDDDEEEALQTDLDPIPVRKSTSTASMADSSNHDLPGGEDADDFPEGVGSNRKDSIEPIVVEKQTKPLPQEEVGESIETKEAATLPVQDVSTELPRVELKTSEFESDLSQLGDSIDDPALDDVNTEIAGEQSEIMRLYGLTDEAYRAMEISYLKDAARLLNISNNVADIASMDNAGAVNLNTALQLMKQQETVSPRRVRTVWPLMFTGIPAETTAFSGLELSQFIDDLNAGFVPNRDNPNPDPSMTQLRSVFTALYTHFMNPGKPDFNSWLNRISSNDFYGLIFSQYNAHFCHNNYLSYQCPKHGCAKLFLEKKPIMDMIVFPNDKTKERFESIRRKDSVLTNLYRTEPIPINEYFALSFRTPSIYSMSFEQASLSKPYKEKYSSIVNFLPMLDAVWVIDHRNNKKHPVNFGVVKDDLEKTVMRKVSGILKIMSTFNTDQRAIIYGEYLKVVKSMQVDDLTYQIPATKCPVCGTEIPAEPADPIGLLFMRARLSIEAASTPALL